MSKNYSHLLNSLAATKAKEVEGDKNADRMDSDTPPANDKEDGKKAKKAKASDEDSEEKDEDEGESEEGHEDREEDEEDEETENEDKEDKKSKKSKKAKKASASMSAADAEVVRLQERLRCARIFQSKAAAGNIGAACQFAFHTELSADASIAILETLHKPEASAATKRPSLDERMKHAPSASVGSDVLPGAGSSPALTEAQMATLDPAQRALMIVNAGRDLSGEAPLAKLPN